jgi:hypothetical protein
MVSEPLSSLRWGERAKPKKVANGCSLGRQEWANPIRVTSGDVES